MSMLLSEARMILTGHGAEKFVLKAMALR
jgi:hypothetical protein